MQLLLESIRVEMPDFNMPLLPFHLRRVYDSQTALWNMAGLPDLSLEIKRSFPTQTFDKQRRDTYKCRVLYHKCAIQCIEWHKYMEKQVKTLQIIRADELHYPYKFADRQSIDALKSSAAMDDILMHRNGLITDLSYANVAFFDKKQWITPKNPLLKGVKRASMLESNTIVPADVPVTDLSLYDKIMLFNALTSSVYTYRYDQISGTLFLDKI